MRVGYASETEDRMGRVWRKQHKLEAKLDEDGQRPKGMRSQTYERIRAQIEAVEERKDAVCYLGIMSMIRCGGMTLDALPPALRRDIRACETLFLQPGAPKKASWHAKHLDFPTSGVLMGHAKEPELLSKPHA